MKIADILAEKNREMHAAVTAAKYFQLSNERFYPGNLKVHGADNWRTDHPSACDLVSYERFPKA